MVRVSMSPALILLHAAVGPVPKQQALDLSLGRNFGSKDTNDKGSIAADSGGSNIGSLVHFIDFVEPNGSNLKWSLGILFNNQSKNVM